jgi:pimeloyl-ACP methyl ester carboxylesterase
MLDPSRPPGLRRGRCALRRAWQSAAARAYAANDLRAAILPLADAGFHVVAPDQRGYGRSGGADVTFDDDLRPSRC